MTKITDMGVMAAAMTMQIGQIVVAAVNTAAQLKIAADQYDLSRQYMDISEEARNHYNSVFAPRENQELAEAITYFMSPTLPENAITYRTRNAANRSFIGKDRDAIKCLSRYATGKASQILISMEQARVEALTYAQVLGEQITFNKSQAEDDRKYARIMGALKRGRDMAADSVVISQVTANVYDSINFEHNWQKFYPPRPPDLRRPMTGARTIGTDSPNSDRLRNTNIA